MMTDYIKNLLKIAGEESVVLLGGRVFFEINELGLVVDFEEDTFSEDEEYVRIDTISNFNERILHSNVLNIEIRKKETVESLLSLQGASVTASMFFVIREMKAWNPSCIKKYDTYYNDDGSDNKDLEDWGMCPSLPNVEFRIKLDFENCKSSSFIERLFLISLNLPKTNKEYCYFDSIESLDKKIQKHFKKDNININILQTNTKARRLGYFKVIADLFGSSSQYPTKRFNKVLENEALKKEHMLLLHRNNKGVIKQTHSGISASPYVDLAFELHFLVSMRNFILQGKLFKVYSVFYNANVSQGNYFELSAIDKLFFLEQILRNDTLYFFILLECIYLSGEILFGDLKILFYDRLVAFLYKIENEIKYHNNDNKKREIFELRKRIEQWEKPEKYLEHVLMPRINWMYDLDLVEISDKNLFSITSNGQVLLSHYWDWQDFCCSSFLNYDALLNAFYIHVFDSVYGSTTLRSLSEAEIKNKIVEALNKSFVHFKTIAPNRVTASQSIMFVLYHLYLTEGIKLSDSYIRTLLGGELQNSFIYKYQSQYRDGYIQKINPS